MPKRILFDELFIAMHVPARLRDADGRAMRRMLQQRSWVRGLREVIRAYVQQSAELRRLHVSVSRVSIAREVVQFVGPGERWMRLPGGRLLQPGVGSEVRWPTG